MKKLYKDGVEIKPSGYEYHYRETNANGNKTRCTSITLHESWSDYVMELDNIDHAFDRKIDRTLIKVTPLYTKEDLK